MVSSDEEIVTATALIPAEILPGGGEGRQARVGEIYIAAGGRCRAALSEAMRP